MFAGRTVIPMKLLKELAIGNIQPMARTNVPELQERRCLRQTAGRGTKARVSPKRRYLVFFMFQKNVRRSFIEYLQSNLYQNSENCYIGSESTFSQSLIYNRPTDWMKDTTSPRPPHGQAMGASDATPLMRGQERHPEQTVRITSQQRPAGELCLFSDSFSADGILRVPSVGVYMEGVLKTESRI